MSFGLLADLKADMGITSANNDVALQRLLDAATTFIQNFCSLDFTSQSYNENYDGNGNNYLGLYQYPITAVALLTVNRIAVPQAPDQWSYGWLIDSKKKGIWLLGSPTVAQFASISGSKFTRGIQNVNVQYTAGYASIPADLQQCCRAIAASAFKRFQRPDITSMNIATMGSIGISNQDVDKTSMLMLMGYRRMN